MRQAVVFCAGLLLLCWAETAAGELRDAFMDPSRGGMHNGIVLVKQDNRKQVPRPTLPALPTKVPTASILDTPSSTEQPESLADPVLVHISASTLKGLHCKPIVCTYDSGRRGRAQLRGNDAWSLAPVSAGVFTDKDAEHYLHLVKVCHSIKGAYSAGSVKGTYSPETGKVQLLLRFPQSATQAVAEVVAEGTAVRDRIAALMADAVIMAGAPVVVDQVTVQQVGRAADTSP